MKSSARNQFIGQISAIMPLGDAYQIELKSGENKIYAHISQFMAAQFKLKIGDTAIVMVKASSIMLLTDIAPFRLAIENCLQAKVHNIETGAVNNIVTLSLPDGFTITAAITLHSSESLDVHCGQMVYAVFHAHQAVIAVLN